MKTVLAVLTVVAGIVAMWYLACVPMNMASVLTAAERAGAEVVPPEAKVRRDMSGMALAVKNPSQIGPI